VAVLTAALSVGVAARQAEPGRIDAVSLGHAEITRALEAVKADPNLATERTIKTLRWKGSSETKRPRTPLFPWLAGLVRWLDQSARLLMWSAVMALAALLLAYIVRVVRRHDLLSGEEATFVAPTHVRDLDIRPEGLPEDVGAAARLLWDRGDHRAALALLYRGMLSRFAYIHRLPIRDSSTEGDCLALAASHLTQGAREYSSRLVLVWQRFVYGGQQAQAATVYGLCDDFGSMLAATPRLDSTGPGDAA
jgi:hypothetical protein